MVGLSCSQILLSWPAIPSNYPVVIPEANHLLCVEFRQVHQVSLKLVLKLQLDDVVLELLDGTRDFMRMSQPSRRILVNGCVKMLDILPHCFLKLCDDVFHLISITRAESLRGLHELHVV